MKPKSRNVGINNKPFPRTTKEWEEYWIDWHNLPRPQHLVSNEMAEEYYDFMDGKRRYLSYKDTITQGQLDTLRILYEFREDNKIYNFIEEKQELDEPSEKRFKAQQVFHKGIVPGKPTPVQKPKLRNTKWKRTKKHGVLQLTLRNYDN